MKIVIAPDSFKESLSAPKVAAAIAQGVIQAYPDVRCVCIPMAEAILAATGGESRVNAVEDALGRSIQAQWGWLPGKIAIIEMACAAGLEHVAVAERDPLRASSFGVGQLIRHALDLGAKHIVLGLGGSATNDAGAGMLQALGLALLDAQGNPLAPGGAALTNLARIDSRFFDARLKDTQVTIASDVNNPLCGLQGASAIF
jgi:glycerate kinase